MILRQTNGYGGCKLRRLLGTVPAVVLLFLAACGGNQPPVTPVVQAPAAEMTAEMTVETGGMALAGAAETGGMALPAAGAVTPVPSPPPAQQPPPVLQAGVVLTVTGAAILYAEPEPMASRFAEYAPGSRFTVIEPDSEHTRYPVVLGDQRWVRVRAEDGLAGWMVEP